MNVSLIISTYNQVDALRCVLESVIYQTVKVFEIIIADDGSSDKTSGLIKQYAFLNLKYCWQPDEGFRLALIRNKAVEMAKGEYIIQIDGDIILHPSFIADHIKWAKPNFFIQGTRVLLSKNTSNTIIKHGIKKILFYQKGIKNRIHTINSLFLAQCFSVNKKHFQNVRACNMSFWKKDFIAVGGYNENFIGWGREDNEFVLKLLHLGVKRLDLKFAANTYHLYHPKLVNHEIEKNERELNKTIQRLKMRIKG